MWLHQETISFLAFILLGVLYGIIFDFFRALRKVRKRNDIVVSIQDIIYFVIVGIILVLFIYVYMKESLRVYLLLSIILGSIIYISIVGNKVVRLFITLIKGYGNLIQFIFLPFDVFGQIFTKQIKFFKKVGNNCCKKVLYMIKSNYIKFKQLYKKLIQKR